MEYYHRDLSVMDVVEICGVARSTVSNWIARKALPAHRSGKKDLIPVEDLILFLKSEKRSVPQVLLQQAGSAYPFRRFKMCWEYRQEEIDTAECRGCSVFNLQISECFTAKRNKDPRYHKECYRCGYFAEYYWPRVAFVHQLQRPAAVYKDLYLWAGNRGWADLCGLKVEELVGAGIEEFIHTDSLGAVIDYSKRRCMGDPTLPPRFRIFLTGKKIDRIQVSLFIAALNNPPGSCLAVLE